MSADKLIHGKLLNFIGVQVARTVAARAVYHARRMPVEESLKDRVAQLRSEGLLIWPNFLPEEEFEAVREEFSLLVRERNSELVTRREGPNTLQTARVGDFDGGLIPSVYRFFGDPRLHAVLQAGEKRPLDRLQAGGEIEVLRQGAMDGDEDPQTQLHSDIFFTTHKAWFYLSDVRIEDGPFVYVRGSHRLNLTRLAFIYRESRRRDPASDHSRRIPHDECDRLGLREDIVTCSRNTLVVANTCGYHRRLPGEAGGERHALHISLRANPFRPNALIARMRRHPRLYRLLRRIEAAHRRAEERR